MIDLTIEVEGATRDELADFDEILRADLLTQGAEAVDYAPRAERDEGDLVGERNADVAWDSATVLLDESSLLVAVVDSILSWLNRHKNVSLTLRIGDDELILTGAGPYTEEEQRAVDLWLERHR